MKNIIIFGRAHRYQFGFEIDSDIKVLQALKISVREPQILNYRGRDAINFDIPNDNLICYDCINWICEQKKAEVNEDRARDCLLKCATEDVTWTESRNIGLTGIFYRRITLLPDVQDMVCTEIDKYLGSLSKIHDEFLAAEQKEKEEYNCQKSEWSVARIYKDNRPVTGEKGRDGYIDAEYISQNGGTVRMVSRDVFDVGCYAYPKRLEGSDALNMDLWTEEEKSLGMWLAKYGEFRGVRM